MIFAHDTEVSLLAAADLVNTARQDPDELATVADLDAFIAKWGYTGSRKRDRAELESVRALRPVLARMWELDEGEAVKLVNSVL
ncbi:MAG TPA: ABATE domain-containing protein, partial [Jatrophihabitantaceae bacterium]|nr:ABATE domain-containing protein [Jatrophihabitantaceae bacterium]